MPKRLYEVRVRENGQKKSKFFEAQNSQEAAKKYTGPGFVMWVQKAGKSQILGIGDFFKIGDRLMAEFKGLPIPGEEGVTVRNSKEVGRLAFERAQKGRDKEATKEELA